MFYDFVYFSVCTPPTNFKLPIGNNIYYLRNILFKCHVNLIPVASLAYDAGILNRVD